MSTDLPITLREITRETYHDILRLQVRPDQQGLVASNAKSLAQALFHDEAWYRGIYAGDTPVGFVMLELLPDKAEYAIWRFMVDGAHQGKGYARHALERVIEHVRTLPGATELLLSHVVAEGHAGSFYALHGFEYTGEEIGGEPIMRLAL